MGMRPRRAVFVVVFALVAYVSLYTWNWKTGVLDRIAVISGLEFTGGVLAPGKWTQRQVTDFWERYIYLMGVRQENEVLRAQLDEFRFRVASLEQKAVQADRLLELLDFSPPAHQKKMGARVVGHRLGPNAVLQTILIDKGIASGVSVDTSVVSPQGVVGRVHRPGLHFSNVLLIIDPNSHVSVMGSQSRIPAILVGQGPMKPLQVNYVPLNAVLAEDEVLITSGLGGMFPKGLPVARVTSVERSAISLFQDIQAEPLVDPKNLEEVVVLLPHNATSEDASPAGSEQNGTLQGVL